jgi:pimeloyl-ACP methyl ester carboxylesterase
MLLLIWQWMIISYIPNERKLIMSQKKYITLTIEGRSIKCLIEGEGGINCLFIGPGKLYFPTIPKDTKTQLFTFHDVDRYFAYLDGADKISEAEINSLTIDTYIEYYESCRKALQLETVALMAPSAIGLIAYEYAIRYPQVVSHVILLGTPSTTKDLIKQQDIFFEGNFSPYLYPRLATPWSINKWTNFKLSHEINNPDNKDELNPDESLISELVADQEKYSINPETELVLRERWHGFNTTMRKHFFESMISNYKISKEITCPTLFISGMYDGVVPFYDIGDKISSGEIKGNITQVILEDAAHLPQFESQHFTSTIRDWLISTDLDISSNPSSSSSKP